MVKTAIGFLLGCLLCLNLSELPAQGWLIVLLIPLLVWFRQTLLTACIVGLLWSGFQAQLRLHDRLPDSKAGQDWLTTGTIASIPEQHDRLLRFDFEPDSSGLPDKVRLSWYRAPDSLPLPGEKWQLSIRLKPPYGMMNPGSFDYEKWLFSEGIGATGYIRAHADTMKLAAAPDWHIDRLRLRLQLRQQLTELLSDARQLPLLLGLSVGLRDRLTPVHWDVLRDTGTSHLLAISGLHIGLAAALGFFLLRWLWSLSTFFLSWLPARQAGALGGMLFALFYALLAGMAIPTQRALIMVSAVMLALLLKRPAFPSHMLAFSLLMVLLFDPLSVLSAGFWLSFGAVALILLTCTSRFPAERGNWFWIHLRLAIGLLPLLVLFFGQFSVIAPLANLLAVPLVSLLVVPLILLAMLMLPISLTLSAYLLQAADILLDGLWQWLTMLSASPVAQWSVSHLPLPLICLMTLMVILLLLPRGMPGKWLGLLVLLPLFLYQPPRPPAGQINLVLLDVGQGLAAVIETARHTLVFDTGPRYSDRFDTGSAVVAPYLDYRGIARIDKLIVSHGDNDHIGGVAGLKKHIPVTQVISSDPEALPDAQVCNVGQYWQWDGVHFDMLHPFSGQAGSKNNRSCVLKVTAQNLSLLLSGDIEKESEQRLLRHDRQALEADLLIVPHHGSRTSSSEQFINAVDPDAALFAVGYRNRYGFPKPDIIERYRIRGSRILRTDHDGAIIFRDTQPVIRWRQHAARLWTSRTTE